MILLSVKNFLEVQESYYSVTELTQPGVTHYIDVLYYWCGLGRVIVGVVGGYVCVLELVSKTWSLGTCEAVIS